MSKVTQFPNARQIEAEACAWIAQLDGSEPSPEDLSAFQEWMQRSKQHREEIRRLSVLWSDLNILTELAVPMKKRRHPWLGLPNVKFFAFAATILVGLAATALVLRSHNLAPTPADGPYFATAVGERKPVVLSDGSKVLLNTDSRIQIAYSGAQRAVHLLRGEAYFEVAHNSDRPFLVYAGANVVRAVGTSFSVHVQKRDVAVVVTEGTVELSSITSTGAAETSSRIGARVIPLAALKAGQSAVVDQQIEAIRTVQPAEVTRKLSWREGVLSFSGESLEQVVNEVSRYTHMTIVISDPSIRNVAIGGYFKAGDTEAMFEALETSFGVRVNRVNDKLVYLVAK